MRALLYDWCQRTNYYYKTDIRDTFDAMGIRYDAFQFDFEQDDIEKLNQYFDGLDTSG